MSSPLEAPLGHASSSPTEVFYGDMIGPSDASRLVRRRSLETTRSQTLALHKAVLEQTGKLAISNSLVLAPGRTKPPRNIGQYDLIPTVPRNPLSLDQSLLSASSDFTTRANVNFEYDRPNGDPYLDARIGLTLAYNGRGVAICAGGMSESGPFIRQVQDISRPRHELEDPQAYLYSSGLRSGFMWRDTLVAAWQTMITSALSQAIPEVAKQPTSIQSARNNLWIYSSIRDQSGAIHVVVDPKKLARQRQNYDQLALRFGGRPDHPRGDYVLGS